MILPQSAILVDKSVIYIPFRQRITKTFVQQKKGTMQKVKLNNRVEMPILGFGVFQVLRLILY